MYIIHDKVNRIIEISAEARYVKRQNNGVVVGCAAADAEYVYSGDTNSYYGAAMYRLAEADEIPAEVSAGYYYYSGGGFYTTERDRAALIKEKSRDTTGIVFAHLAESGAFDDATLTEHAEQFLEWSAGADYAAGAVRSYGGKLYRCIQTHAAQSGWEPSAVPALWREVGDPAEEYPGWSQPLCASDAYSAGDKVSFGGSRWVSDIDANVWQPGVYGWNEENCLGGIF